MKERRYRIRIGKRAGAGIGAGIPDTGTNSGVETGTGIVNGTGTGTTTGAGTGKRKLLTIALVSDFHNGDAAAVCAVLDRCRPDLIAVTGDLFIGYHHRSGRDLFREQKNVLPLIRHCVKLAPTYLSLGNHEWVASEENLLRLEEEGVVILDNRWIVEKRWVLENRWNSENRRVRDDLRIQENREIPEDRRSRKDRRITEDERTPDKDRRRGGKPGLVIGGLTSAMMTDCRNYRRRFGADAPYPHETRHTDRVFLRTEADWLDDFTAQEGYKILLSHHPEYWCLREPMLRKRKIDLVLSGHAHGGQIRLFGQGLYSPGQGLFPKYAGGIYRGPHGCMVVSRGTTNTAPFVPRLFNPPEVVVIDVSEGQSL